MKLKAYLLTIILLTALTSSAQSGMDTDKQNNLNNVYLCALKRYCESVDSSTTKTIYIDPDSYIGENWPREIKGIQISYLDFSAIKKVIKKMSGKMTLLRITPIEFRAGKFYVGVIPFSTTYKKRRLFLQNGGGLMVHFEYEPKAAGFIYSHEKWGGI